MELLATLIDSFDVCVLLLSLIIRLLRYRKLVTKQYGTTCSAKKVALDILKVMVLIVNN